LNTEIVIHGHGPHNQIGNSTSANTITDSDEIEIKPVFIIFVYDMQFKTTFFIYIFMYVYI